MAGPDVLVWLDMEMTGLDPERERIIEVATILTDGQLDRDRGRPRARHPSARRGPRGDGRLEQEAPRRLGPRRSREGVDDHRRRCRGADDRVHQRARRARRSARCSPATRSIRTAGSSAATCPRSTSGSTTGWSTSRRSRSSRAAGTRRSIAKLPAKKETPPRARRHPRVDRRAALLPSNTCSCQPRRHSTRRPAPASRRRRAANGRDLGRGRTSGHVRCSDAGMRTTALLLAASVLRCSACCRRRRLDDGDPEDSVVRRRRQGRRLLQRRPRVEYIVAGHARVTLDASMATKPTPAPRRGEEADQPRSRSRSRGSSRSTSSTRKTTTRTTTFGGFGGMAKAGAYEDLGIPSAPTSLTYDFTFKQLVAGGKNLTSKLPIRTVGGKQVFDLEIGKPTNDELGQLETNEEWYRSAPWDALEPGEGRRRQEGDRSRSRSREESASTDALLRHRAADRGRQARHRRATSAGTTTRTTTSSTARRSSPGS